MKGGVGASVKKNGRPPRPGTEGGRGAGSRQGRERVDSLFFAVEALLVIMNVSQIKIDFSNAK